MIASGSFSWVKAGPGWLFASAVAAVLVTAAAWHWLRWDRRRELRLQQVGTVCGLFIYPIKSCKGVAVKRAEVTKLGLRSGDLLDRSWLVIKEDGHMVTARQEPRLVLLSVTNQNGGLTLRAPEMKDLHIPVSVPTKNPVKNCRLFGTDIQGRDCGDDAAKWITAYLKSEPYRIVCFEPNMTPRNSNDLMKSFRPVDKITYSDCSPIMVLSEASIEKLNSKMEKKIQVSNFRPSILVTGCGPHEEDTWNDIIIGSAQMKGIVACPRCILTTVDPDTGIISRKEPLNTLKSYRLPDPSAKHLYGSSPLFGWYFGIEKTGALEVGDLVYKIVQ